MKSNRLAYLSPGGTRAAGEEGPLTREFCLGKQPLRGEHTVSLNPVMLTLADTESSAGALTYQGQGPTHRDFGVG